YSVLHVREDDGWKMASVREWVPDPSDVTTEAVAWLIGDWTAKGEGVEVRITYAWEDDNKSFLRGRYRLLKGDKTLASGTQIIGANPAGGLRAWHFDANGSYGEGVWMPDGNRWVMDVRTTLPDGSEQTEVDVVIPLGKDAFTWQATQRTIAGSAQP